MTRSASRICILTALLGLACGPQATVLDATGVFAGLTIDSIQLGGNDQAGQHLEFALTGLSTASVALSLTRAPDESPPSCWRSDGNQHACTENAPAGILEHATFSSAGLDCNISGWVERLDGVWQMDLDIAPQQACDDGHYSVTFSL